MSDVETGRTGLEIAIIGMAGRFPGAPDIAAFWENLRDGGEAITRFDRDELAARGVARETLDAPDFVAAGAPVEGSDLFDAEFFGYSPAEAALIDPQQRIFLECAWHAMEHAGYAPGSVTSPVGVYAAAAMNGYLLNLHGNAALRASVTPYEIFTSNDKDFLASRAAFKLNLRGPAVTVQTACSSSLVAVHMAAQSLIAGECDMALAGGVALSRQDGYRAMPGSILSPTGQCRAFDAGSDGTVAGNGVGLVLLKRLDDALADGDRIEAVIKGSAINNDGAGKASFTAPDVAAQAEVIAAAQAAAEVAPETISYVEAHGTGTALGDPVEIAALTRAFRRGTDRRGFCAIGSVKTSIGHLDTAAGIAGLIKTVLMLRHKTLAPSLHFETPNPRIDFAASPFAVAATPGPWESEGPRRAGVSSFGIGGTNAHLVLEEAPAAPAASDPPGPHLLTLSARTGEALSRIAAALAEHLERDEAPLADIAHTLRVGRAPFRWRHSVVATSRAQAVADFRDQAGPAGPVPGTPPAPIFLFPGQGSQYPGMARRLYDALPAFAATLDRAAAHRGDALLPMIFCEGETIHRTENAQLALFTVEVGLAEVWAGMGITPHALLGHSLGELSAACIAGVFGFEAGLDLVAERGRLMQAAPPGAMLSVLHPDHAIDHLLADEVEIAVENGPGLTVVSGPMAAITATEARLDAAGLGHRRLSTSHGFHSAAMTGAAEAFADYMRGVDLSPPAIPVLSNLTGTWLSPTEATDPGYWARQLRNPVRFGANAALALQADNPVLLELGPASGLGKVLAHRESGRIVSGLEHGRDDRESHLRMLGAAWEAGLAPDRASLAPSNRRRVALPGYPFARERHWISPDDAPAAPAASVPGAAAIYVPSWRRVPLPAAAKGSRRSWLVFDDGTIGAALAKGLERTGDDVMRIVPGEAFAETGYRTISLPRGAGGMADLFAMLAERGITPTDAVFLWPLEGGEIGAQAESLHDLVACLSDTGHETRLTLVTTGAADVTGTEPLAKDQARLHGLIQVAGQEYPRLGCRILDLDPGETARPAALAPDLARILRAEAAPITARRGGRHWTLAHAQDPLPDMDRALRRGGVYVVIGQPASGVGRIWADRLANHDGVRLALVEEAGAPRMSLPEAGQVLRREAACGDPDAIRDALDAVEARWGRIDGIFLATPFSDVDTTAPLALLGADQHARVQATCLAPLAALARAVEGTRVSFCCVQSSLSTSIGGVGLAAYAGAHAHAELQVADLERGADVDWYAIGWDALAADTDGSRPGAGAGFALDPDQVWQATLRIIANRATGVSMVSRGDLDARRAEWLNPEPTSDPTETANAGRRRPEIETPFVAPRTALEASVAGILQDLLGLDRVGVEDGFFELGGHSLLAIRVIARLREAYPVEIEMRDLLAGNPTAARIAQLIEDKMAGDAELAALMDEVSGLSEDDLRAALEEAPT